MYFTSLFHVASHVSILCLWYMLYLYFSYMHIHTCTIIYFHVICFHLILVIYYHPVLFVHFIYIRKFLFYHTLCFRILSVLFLCWLKSNTIVSYLYFSYQMNIYLIFYISRRSTRLILLPSYHILSYVFTYAFMYLSYHILSYIFTYAFMYFHILYCHSVLFSLTVIMNCVHVLISYTVFMLYFSQGCQTRTGPVGPTGKTGDRAGNRSG